MTLEEYFKSVADAIRAKTGETEEIAATSFPDEISKIETGVDTSDATAVALDIAQGKTAYVNGKKITGTYAGYTHITSKFSFPAGTGSRSVSFTVSGLASLEYVYVYGTGNYSGAPIVFNYAYTGTATSQISVSGNVVTFTCTSPLASALNLNVIVIGKA